MLAEDSIDVAEKFASDGFVSPLEILSVEEAADHRRRMEEAEAEFGKLHYQYKAQTILSSPYELAIHPRVLDAVEQMIGPDILLYSAGYIIKEPHSAGHVSWHQDLTYWGFSEDAQVSLWLALSPATPESGCMRMLPGSHRGGRLKHQVTDDSTNILYQGQTVSDVDEDDAVLC
ncbi:MAG: phytanoyl-CoA dioxygenase family protein, partial [Pseudomonadota bacterium]|nr:phytanoyl-CoA dioxygenase family protein [Pseudomonadota bacterium]